MALGEAPIMSQESLAARRISLNAGTTQIKIVATPEKLFFLVDVRRSKSVEVLYWWASPFVWRGDISRAREMCIVSREGRHITL